MEWKITPKILIVSVLHVSGNQAIPIKALIKMGGLFGFTSNAIRVTAARLIRNGRLESDERGFYKLMSTETPISRFVNSWKTGEARIRPWSGRWLCCLMPRVGAGQDKKDAKALMLPGFREGLPRLWIRPDNLEMNSESVKELMVHQGMNEGGELFTADGFSRDLEEGWKNRLWPVDKLIRNYESIQERIKKSMGRLNSLPTENALMESYLVGTEVIHVLVTDPLLPEEMMPSSYRTALAAAMHEYNEMGKKVWMEAFEDLKMPSPSSQAGLEGLDISTIIRQTKP